MAQEGASGGVARASASLRGWKLRVHACALQQRLRQLQRSALLRTAAQSLRATVCEESDCGCEVPTEREAWREGPGHAATSGIRTRVRPIRADEMSPTASCASNSDSWPWVGLRGAPGRSEHGVCERCEVARFLVASAHRLDPCHRARRGTLGSAAHGAPNHLRVGREHERLRHDTERRCSGGQRARLPRVHGIRAAEQPRVKHHRGGHAWRRCNESGLAGLIAGLIAGLAYCSRELERSASAKRVCNVCKRV